MKTLIFTHLYQRPDTTAESLSRLRGLLDLWLDHLRGPGKYTGDIILFTNLERIERDGLLLRPMPNVPVDQRRAHMHRILCYDLVPTGDYDVALQADLDVLAVDDVNPLFPKDESLWAAPSDLLMLEWRHAWTLLPKWQRAAHKLTGWRMAEPGASACVVASRTSVWERNFGSWARLIRAHGDRPAPHFGDQSFLNVLRLKKSVPMSCWPRELIVHNNWDSRRNGAKLLHFPGDRKAFMPQYRMV